MKDRKEDLREEEGSLTVWKKTQIKTDTSKPYHAERRGVEPHFAEALELHSFAKHGREARQAELGDEAAQIHGERDKQTDTQTLERERQRHTQRERERHRERERES